MLSDEVDMVFMLDGSRTVSDNNFNRTKCLLKNLTTMIDVGHRKVFTNVNFVCEKKLIRKISDIQAGYS